MRINPFFTLFFFNDTATTEIYTLSLHDALPIFKQMGGGVFTQFLQLTLAGVAQGCKRDRKSTRLNSSHQIISYAVFCLKKKRNQSDSPYPADLLSVPHNALHRIGCYMRRESQFL